MVKRARKQTALRFPPELLEALQRMKVESGMLITEQVERAVYRWLVSQGRKPRYELRGEEPDQTLKAASRRAETRRKATTRQRAATRKRS